MESITSEAETPLTTQEHNCADWSHFEFMTTNLRWALLSHVPCSFPFLFSWVCSSPSTFPSFSVTTIGAVAIGFPPSSLLITTTFNIQTLHFFNYIEFSIIAPSETHPSTWTPHLLLFPVMLLPLLSPPSGALAPAQKRSDVSHLLFRRSAPPASIQVDVHSPHD